jgi:heme/copper-type cytochrome/quinol oxidase subunit 2
VRTDLPFVRKAGALLAGLALAVSLVACGTSTVHETMAATFVSSGAAGFYPTTITVNKKDEVIITVGNGTDKTHGFSIDGYHVQKTVDPNQTIQVKFKAKRAGTFKIYCQLHPTHQTAVLQVQ